jgi:phosphoserine phosphatase RsbU/P
LDDFERDLGAGEEALTEGLAVGVEVGMGERGRLTTNFGRLGEEAGGEEEERGSGRMKGNHTVSALILACDDNPDILLALSLLLRGAGHRVKTVESPGAAREAVAAAKYDLILTDMNFTRDTTSGEEGLALIGELRGGAPVIAMTAWGDIELTVRAMQRGAVDFLTKPFDNLHLLEKVDAHLQNKGAQEGELALARKVQRRLLAAPPTMAGISIAVRFEPANEVGGDYYDFFVLREDRLAFLLADVSGKGIPAALMMANLQALFRAGDHSQPQVLLTQINRLFHAATTETCYATLFYAIWDRTEQTLVYANCGHPAGELDGEELGSNNTVIGMFGNVTITMDAVSTAGRKKLMVYSDGLTDEGDDVTVLTLEFA